jgi:hypothetical protein
VAGDLGEVKEGKEGGFACVTSGYCLESNSFRSFGGQKLMGFVAFKIFTINTKGEGGGLVLS